MNAKEVLHCVLQMEKLNAERSYRDMSVLLGDLDKQHVTAEQMETSDIVRVLYRILKSCKQDNVKKTVKGMLAKWKRDYSKERGGLRQHGQTDLELKTVSDDRNTPPELPQMRAKCIQLLLSALSLQPSDHDKASNLAQEIEKHIHLVHKTNEAKYKTCVRSKISNLKNPKSSHLREGLLNGSLSPEAFARMSTEEMACADLQRLRQQYSSQSVNERQLPQSLEGTATNEIRCKRCDGTECRVTQVSRGTLFLPAWAKQSGPDDDSMTFVTCGTCGQQWYHNKWICL